MIKESLLNTADAIDTQTVMAGDYYLQEVKAGQTIRIVDSEGNQAADTQTPDQPGDATVFLWRSDHHQPYGPF